MVSVETTVQKFLESVTAFVALIPATRICAYSVDRELKLVDGSVAFYREVGHIPQNTLTGFTGLSLHSYAVTILSYDPSAASLAVSALKSYFNIGSATWPYKPTGWTSGDAYIKGGEIRDGSTENTPEVTSDFEIIHKTVVLDLWFQE